MSEEKEFILSKDGKKLCIHQWEKVDAKRILCIVHGLGEHGARYAPLAKHLNSHDTSVYAVDLRGHGLTQGKRGHTPSYLLLQQDIEELLKHARSQNTEAKMFLMGHSMGGNLVASYVKNDQTKELSGYILSAPFFDVAFAPPKWKVTLAKLVGRVLPSLTQGNELEVKAISREETEVEKYTNDPLVHDQISIGWYLSFSRMGLLLVSDTRPISFPGLIYHGDADRLVSFEATEKFASNNPNAKWVPLKGVYHEPHNDLGKEIVYGMITDFLETSK